MTKSSISETTRSLPLPVLTLCNLRNLILARSRFHTVAFSRWYFSLKLERCYGNLFRNHATKVGRILNENESDLFYVWLAPRSCVRIWLRKRWKNNVKNF